MKVHLFIDVCVFLCEHECEVSFRFECSFIVPVEGEDMHTVNWPAECACVCMCVCGREREKEREVHGANFMRSKRQCYWK